ncbi:universal stress protein [Amycolatopsis anabasis]|uniref:universal stress protein n=1 Tax=Amycolatopsis anabasis TaxID=1840409 RepID=UPI00131E3CFE|nr:universal stress protein [Amycolatopsis anabasis]
MTYPEPGRTVTVGVDGSTAAISAVRWAAAEAVRREATLRLFHACVLPPMRNPRPLSAAVGYSDGLFEDGRRWLREAKNAAMLEQLGLEVTTELTIGNAVDQLIYESDNASLLVLGSRGIGGFRDMLAGSVAVALPAHGHCPMVVVRSATPVGSPPVQGPVVVGVDGSPASDAAIGYAFEAADDRGAPLIAVHAWNDIVADAAWSMPSLKLDRHAIQAAEEERLHERMNGWREKYSDVRVYLEVIADRPSHALLARGETAQLIVVGSRGRGRFAGAALGSTTRALLHHAVCPVAVLPHDLAR